jgi:hypothetical protein
MKNDLISRLRRPHLLQRIWQRFLSIRVFFLRQWVLLIARGTEEESPSWEDFTFIVPPPDRFWADPFVWVHDGDYYVFFEELLLSTNRGHIACLKVDEQLNHVASRIVLERPYHLSYPFLFEYSNHLYMLPETKKNHTVELYRCNRFPDQWEYTKALISGISAVDSTLLESNGKWWLFANIAEDSGSSYDSLHLFYADHPFSDHWVSHPRNPIVKDIRSARPAGRIFSRNGVLIRPSQDCSVRYGYSINFNRISTLSESDYAEICEWSLRPPTRRGVLGIHTWNASGGLQVIDAFIYRNRFNWRFIRDRLAS